MSPHDTAIDVGPSGPPARAIKHLRSWGKMLISPFRSAATGTAPVVRWQPVLVLIAVLTLTSIVQQTAILQRLDLARIVLDQYVAEVTRRVEGGDSTAEVVPTELARRQHTARLQRNWAWIPNLVALPAGYFLIGTIYFGLMRLLGASGRFVEYQWATAASYLPAVVLMNAWTSTKAMLSDTLTKQEVEKLSFPFSAKDFIDTSQSRTLEVLLDSLNLFNVLTIILAVYWLRRIGRSNVFRACVAVAVLWISYIGVKLVVVGAMVPEKCAGCVEFK